MNRNLTLLIILILFAACKNESTNEVSVSSNTLFQKLSPKATGINFKNELKVDVSNNYNVLSFEFFYNGSGVAIGDINNDGLSDIFFSANTGPNKLYLNKGQMQFEDISSSAGIAPGNWSTGANMVDINKDGLLDIYICQAGPENTPGYRDNLLYINLGNNSFKESAKEYGLADPKLSMQAVFFDYDRDGWIDCYLLNESIYANSDIEFVQREIQDLSKLRASSGTLYKNAKGRFVDVSKEAGILRHGFGLGVAVTDFNNDHYPDLYVTNDYSPPDIMWINQKDGTFKDEIKDRTDQTSWFSMGIDIADINNDGDLDIGVVDMSTQDHFYGKTLMAPMNTEFFRYTHEELNYHRQHMFNVLQLNQGNGSFSNIAGLSKTLSTEWSWAPLFADFDNDGDKDYYVTNGFKKCHRDNDFQNNLKAIKAKNNNDVPLNQREKLYQQIPSYKSKNLVYENKAFSDFKENGNAWGLDDLSFSNGAAYGDLDNDGDLDLVVNNIDDYAFVYENKSTKNYLRIKLASEKYAYGTRVNLFSNGIQQTQEYNPTKGYLSKIEDYVHFGLGESAKIDSIQILWNDQYHQTIQNISINQLLILDRKNALPPTKGNKKKEVALFKETINLQHSHKENFFDDFKKEILLPYKQSTLGPFMSTADVDNNGLDDLYIGGAKGSPGKLFLQQQNGSWTTSSDQVFKKDMFSEDMKSVFFDVDGDNDLDLYVVSGGSEFIPNDKFLQDRLYYNNGKGSFTKGLLPEMRQAGMSVTASDFDKDGDTDLFVSGRIQPQKYPYAAPSYILENKDGILVPVSSGTNQSLAEAGIINDGQWIDIDGDKDQDLIVAGEWTSIQVYENNKGTLSLKEDLPDSKGWWYSLHVLDIDQDGDQDFIAGNLGLNSKFSASKEKPFKVYANDFDNNGSCDIVLSKDYKGEQVPVRGRQCSSEQMPFISDKFKSYEDFANANIVDILGDKLDSALALEANTFESLVFINDGNGNFEASPLPIQAQAFPIWSIQSIDLNKDQLPDLILAGNMYGMEIETPRLDAGKGLVLLNNGKAGFTAVSPKKSGLLIKGDLRDLAILNSTNQKLLITSRNDDALVTHLLNE